MGRRKIDIKPIKEYNRRKITLKKRAAVRRAARAPRRYRAPGDGVRSRRRARRARRVNAGLAFARRGRRARRCGRASSCCTARVFHQPPGGARRLRRARRPGRRVARRTAHVREPGDWSARLRPRATLHLRRIRLSPAFYARTARHRHHRCHARRPPPRRPAAPPCAQGLVKKAIELSVLCECEIGLFVMGARVTRRAKRTRSPLSARPSAH